MALTWVNGTAADTLDAADRGLAFGDGLFETMRLAGHRIPLLDLHLERLGQGLDRLKIAASLNDIRTDIGRFLEAAADGHPGDGVLKLLVSRGSGGIGYRFPAAPAATSVLRLLPPRVVDAALVEKGVTLRTCQTRLSSQPLLAGLKHLNRLEQVLARAEWDDPSVFEGVMLDQHGSVIECVSSNLFVVSAGRLLTPVLDQCGVAGVMRRLIMEQVAPYLGVPVAESRLTPAIVSAAQEVFICNSVIGVLPVVGLGQRQWSPGKVTRAVQRRVEEVLVA